jgi:hypothetical protein
MGKAQKGALYEGRGAKETGQTAKQLKAAKAKAGVAATKAAQKKKITTQRTASAAMGKAQKGALYEGRKAAETGSTAKQLKKRAGISTKKTTTSKPRAI